MKHMFDCAQRSSAVLGIRRRGTEPWGIRLRVCEGFAGTAHRRWRAVEQLRAKGCPPMAGSPQNRDWTRRAPEIPGPPPTRESLRGRPQPALPSLRLMLAVLDDALDTLVFRTVSSVGIRAETTTWIVSDDIQWPFSFVNLCDALDVDVPALRRRLAPWLGVAQDDRVAVVPAHLDRHPTVAPDARAAGAGR